jgi:hypothetical protein
MSGITAFRSTDGEGNVENAEESTPSAAEEANTIERKESEVHVEPVSAEEPKTQATEPGPVPT